MDVSGIVVIAKPVGFTSTSVVARMRRLMGLKRVGHAGTLDPFACGVLPVAVGRATGAIAFMQDYDKVYRVRVQLGAATDTMDLAGEIVARADVSAKIPDRATIVRELAALVGVVRQQAPLYSAVKVAGKPLYKYAREGKGSVVARPWREITVYGAELLAIDHSYEYMLSQQLDMPQTVASNDLQAAGWPVLDIRFRTGKGAYIRALADELGRRLGCYGFAVELLRERCGPYDLSAAVTTDDLFARFNELEREPERLRANMMAAGEWLEPLSAFVDYPHYELDFVSARAISRGQEIACPLSAARQGDVRLDRKAVFTYQGRLLAVVTVGDLEVKVQRVFVSPDAVTERAVVPDMAMDHKVALAVAAEQEIITDAGSKNKMASDVLTDHNVVSAAVVQNSAVADAVTKKVVARSATEHNDVAPAVAEKNE